MTYDVQDATFITPQGRPAPMLYRANSSDWNTLWACMNEDEYGFKYRKLSGVAVDIGAHLGGVTIGLALDNPDLQVIAVEAVPPNAELLRQNVARNGLEGRVTVMEGAAGDGGPVDIRYGYTGNENAEHHAFIGNSTVGANVPGATAHYPQSITLTNLLVGAGQIDLIKIDCEGSEYPFLADRNVSEVATILGEWHPIEGFGLADLLRLLEPTHSLTFTGPQAGPGGFVALRR